VVTAHRQAQWEKYGISFEKELNYPLTLINTSITEKFDLKDYEVLILTTGNYSKLKDTIIDYVKRGGRVIAIENAISVFAVKKPQLWLKQLIPGVQNRNLLRRK
jgi:hypothetical protein